MISFDSELSALIATWARRISTDDLLATLAAAVEQIKQEAED